MTARPLSEWTDEEVVEDLVRSPCEHGYVGLGFCPDPECGWGRIHRLRVSERRAALLEVVPRVIAYPENPHRTIIEQADEFYPEPGGET